MTADELAAELEVSPRTIYRDIEALSSAGIPIYADRGPTGGYQLIDGYRTRLTGLTSAEAQSLFLAGLPGPAEELGLKEFAAAAQLKLLAALPTELRSRAEQIRQRFHLDTPTWFRGDEPTEHLATIADAVWEQRRVRMTYQRWGNQTVEREVDPYGLVLKAGTWYFVGSGRTRLTRSATACRRSEIVGLSVVGAVSQSATMKWYGRRYGLTARLAKPIRPFQTSHAPSGTPTMSHAHPNHRDGP